jgi:hypothetical protein
MSKENGFLQLRRGIWEHVRNGRMNVNMLAVYVYILSEADTRTGIWNGCAQSIRGVLHLPLSTVKYALSKMDGIYIRRFMVPGRRFCYPILCHKFVLTNGPDVGRMLDALNSKSEKALAFFPEPISPDIQPEHSEDVGRQKRSKNREERKSQKIESTAPASQAPTSHPFFEIWNQNRGQLSEAKALGKGRLAKCRLRARDVGEERFLTAVRKAASTPFCLGLNDRGWKADFDWIIANDTNATKVIEGRYDGQPQEPVWRQKQKLEEQRKAEAVARFEEGY